ncbi:hypothetical protein CERZMDRAFT_91936 [Cercospora zeae-maydis SCOH1-5]|uniref:Uncharacterized protein n=1 Tax=Cercospora zeae-maydis SCOH1-5 TaxID=717836 RepID=A0A6A6EYY1_9PEZI|nr:hypothetical protein CERZMDRAFT_91936 [Cercospora zeae-maydis SCOH1-5]
MGTWGGALEALLLRRTARQRTMRNTIQKKGSRIRVYVAAPKLIWNMTSLVLDLICDAVHEKEEPLEREDGRVASASRRVYCGWWSHGM